MFVTLIVEVEVKMKKQNGQPEDFSVSAAKAARRVGVTTRTIINKAIEGRLPYVRKGASTMPRYFFRRSDIEEMRRTYQDGRTITRKASASAP